MSSAAFDPVAYKRTTAEQWQTAAEPWYRWGPTLEAWLGEATETMLDMAGAGPAAPVLHLAPRAWGPHAPAAPRGAAGRPLLAHQLPRHNPALDGRAARDH